MSDFHDALRRAAQRHGEAVAPSLTADAVVTSSVDGISRGRRRRSATQAGVGALGVVAIGVAGWLVLPLAGTGDGQPAGPEDSVKSGPYRYEVGGDSEAYLIEEPSVMLKGEDAVMCGDELSLEPGVTVHNSKAFESELWLEAELTTLRDTIGTPTAEPRPIDPDDPDGIMTGWDPDASTWALAVGGVAQSIEATPLLMDDGVVTSIGQGLWSSNNVGGQIGASGGASIPRIDECGDSERTFEELLDLEHGDPMDTLIVAQFWAPYQDGTEPGEGTLLATIVVDPLEPANFTESPSTDDYPGEPTVSPTAGAPADLRAPEGDEYQAFIVEKPQPGCAPLADLRAAGRPSTDDYEYTVNLPVTAVLDERLWSGVSAIGYLGDPTEWFAGLDAWLVADEATARIRDPHLAWEPPGINSGWAVVRDEFDPLRGQGCAVNAPIPEVGGSVFLVLDRVDWDATGIQVQDDSLVDDFQTWVYLGEAD